MFYEKETKFTLKRILTLFLVFVLIVSFIGCNTGIAKSLTGDQKANPVIAESPKENDILTNQFALELLKTSLDEEGNTLISPLSVLCALAMTANGAKDETLKQMEQVFGLTVDQLNQSIYVYRNNLPKEKACNVTLANSIWFTDDIRFTVNEDFLQKNADYYGAEIYEAPFDQSTVADMNRWVREKTDGMIPFVLDKIPSTAIMYLINALTFDAEWMDRYQKEQMDGGTFTREDGFKEDVEYMKSEESWYLEHEYATGVMKYYKG